MNALFKSPHKVSLGEYMKPFAAECGMHRNEDHGRKVDPMRQTHPDRALRPADKAEVEHEAESHASESPSRMHGSREVVWSDR